MTEAMPFLQKFDITFLRPPTIQARLLYSFRKQSQKLSFPENKNRNEFRFSNSLQFKINVQVTGMHFCAHNTVRS